MGWEGGGAYLEDIAENDIRQDFFATKIPQYDLPDLRGRQKAPKNYFINFQMKLIKPNPPDRLVFHL